MTGSNNYDTWPLVLHPVEAQFFKLQTPGVIVLSESENLRLACPGAGNQFVNFPPLTNIITISCLDETFFLYNDLILNFYDSLSCENVSI